MNIINKISINELKKLSKKMKDIVKADVDIKNKTVVIDAYLHADMETFLLEKGSDDKDIWGINLHPFEYGNDNFIEFDSMINIKPRLNNNSRYIEDESIREEITNIINGCVIDA